MNNPKCPYSRGKSDENGKGKFVKKDARSKEFN